jgi:hypothetical protein
MGDSREFAKPASGLPSDIGRTVRRRVDVASAFADEVPTAPASQTRSRRAPGDGAEELDLVGISVPLDARPELAVADTDVPWRDLGLLATEVLLRVDGAKTTMSIVTGLSAPPSDGVRALARLVGRGIVRLVSPAPPSAQ